MGANSVNIIIEPEARNFILERDKVITITVARRPGSICKGGGEVQLPSVQLGIDQEKAHTYHKLALDGIDAYYSESAASCFTAVKIKVEKFLFSKKLVAVR